MVRNNIEEVKRV